MAGDRIIDMGLTQNERLELAHETTHRAVDQVYPNPNEFEEAIAGEKRLTAYMGIDPTAPDIHIGHGSQLHKLSRLQLLGHEVILLIGDFTATIGDPTDKSAARVKLSRDEVESNAEDYKTQAAKVLDFEHPSNPIQTRFNSEWLGEMDFGEVLELASEFTVQQIMERDMFQRRIAAGQPVRLHEFIYPLMQGWDSVKLNVDIEVGGSDQTFNMLAGSTLVKRYLEKQKYVLAGQLLVDPSGKKIGKTEGNMITLNDSPYEMFHKVMMWGDAMVPHALELCTTLSMDQIKEVETQVANGQMTPLDSKLFLAEQIVSELHNASDAEAAHSQYNAVTSSTQEINPEDLQGYSARSGQSMAEVLVASGLASSLTKARRLIEGNAVRVDGRTVGEDWTVSTNNQSAVLQVGKKRLGNYRRLDLKED